jgi:MFS family permease
MSKEKWVTRDYIIAWISSFLVAMNFILFMVTTSSYAIRAFGVSSALAGFSASSFVLSAILSRIVVGRIIFRVGCIRVLTTGLAASAVVTAGYLLTSGIGLLIAVRVVHGLCVGVASTAIFTVGSVLIPKNKSGVGMGYFSLSTTLSTAAGPFLAAMLTRGGEYTSLFIVTVVLAALNICLIPLIRLDRACVPAPGEVAKPPKGLAGIIDTNILPVALVCGLAYATYGFIVGFLSVSSKGTGLENAAAFFFIFYAAGILFTRPLTGRVFDRRGENPMMYAGLAIFSAGMLLTGIAKTGATILAAAFLVGAGIGAVMSVTLSIGVKYAAPERLGMANSTFYIFLDAGLTVGPVVGGFLAPHIGYAGTYVLGMPVALGGILLYYFIHGKRHSHAYAIKAANN